MFWSNGDSWGVCKQNGDTVELAVNHGKIQLKTFSIRDTKDIKFKDVLNLNAGDTVVLNIK